jgi:hypothetical protein
MLSDTFYARVDNKSHVFIRTEKHWFDIYACSVLTDGSRIGCNDGLIPNAVKVSEEEVAELVAAQEKEYNKRLARVEASLRKWIAFRQAWSRKGEKKLSLQKREVVK